MGNVVQNNKFEQGLDHWNWVGTAPDILTDSDGVNYVRILPNSFSFIWQQLYGLVANKKCRIKMTAKTYTNPPTAVRINIDNNDIFATPDSNDVIDIFTDFNLSTSDPIIIIYGSASHTTDVTGVYVQLI